MKNLERKLKSKRVRQGRYVIGKVKDCSRTSKKIFALIKNGNETTVVAEEKFYKIMSFKTKLSFDLVGKNSYSLLACMLKPSKLRLINIA